MKYNVLAAAIIATASAVVLPRGSCCFSLTASGGASGTVGQLGDGQNRVGGCYPAGQYCIGPNGGITDGQGRGCILTPPTTQFQCDTGASPTSGFAVSSSGQLTYNGNNNFVICPVNDNGEYNIYTQALSGQEDCKTIQLSTGGQCAPSSTLPPASPQPCPTALQPGSYEFPHLIVPIDKDRPDTAYGTVYSPEFDSVISTIFSFDIPRSDLGKTCSLIFVWPTQDQLQTSSFQTSGSGGLIFTQLTNIATQSTTYNNAGTGKQVGSIASAAPGNSYVVETTSCPAGTTVSIEVSSTDTLSLTYFQDDNPSPIGLYVTTC